MAVFHVFLLVLVFGIVHHSHGRTYESESITINGSTDTPAVKPRTNRPPWKPPTNRPPWKPRKYQYDILFLALQWPKSLCNTGVPCIRQIPKYFTVHGLWPQPNIRPLTCDRHLFPFKSLRQYYSQLRSIMLHFSHKKISVLDYMYNHWPNLNRNNDREWLWDHEYQRHGSCFWPFRNDPLLYFRTTVDLAMQIGILTPKLLNGEGIQLDTKYSLCDYENAIFRLYKVFPNLQYNMTLGQLNEIRFCFNWFKGKWVLINCRRISNCGNSQVMIPRP